MASPVGSDAVAFGVTLAAAGATVEAVKLMARRRWLSSPVARKVMHIAVGPVFVLCWRLFSNNPKARFWAATVPALITANFAAVGLGVVKDESTVRSMCRTGEPKELLRGPLIYGIVFVLSTMLFWRHPTGVVALMVLCGGDGFAALAGKRWGRRKLPWSSSKTWVGSAAFFVASVVLGSLYTHLAQGWGWAGASSAAAFLPRLLTLAGVATAVESLPVADFDNLSVFVSVLLTDRLLG